MEIAMEAVEDVSVLGMTERIVAAAEVLEQAAARLTAGLELSASLDRASAREAELREQLDAAQATIAQMRASGRKTAGAGVSTMVAKEGAAFEVGGLDAALGCLSVEQRIAVKAGLMRSGLVG